MDDKRIELEDAAETKTVLSKGKDDALAKRSSEIAIAGPSQSGKTMLLSALLNDQSLFKDVCDPDPNPKLRNSLEPAGYAGIYPPSTGFETSIALLTETYYEIAKAADSVSTEKTYEHRFRLAWQDAQTHVEEGKSKKKHLPNIRRVDKPIPLPDVPYHDKWFSMVDGRGGLLTEKVNLADEDQAAKAEEYKERIHRAESLILTLSSRVEHEFKDKEVNQIEFLLQQRDSKMTDGAGVPLEHVSLCFTKAETCFLDLGHDAYDAISDPQEALNRMPVTPYQNLIDVLDNLQHRFSVKIRAFPVSTFGFVQGAGAANFYPHAEKPGLLTRTISKEELDEADGTGRKWRDHFPHPISDDLAKGLWKPFNITPAFFFAATGRVTGPMSFSIADLQSRRALG